MITHARRRVVWTTAANEEITEAALWYEDQETGLGERFLDAVRTAAQAASNSPDNYARVYRDLRRILVHRFPYALIFRESSAEVFVIACYHLHRDPNVWQSRG